ncbi:hypothetical protein [Paenibacillus sp. FSL R7-0128]|uniref:hypothetical protein n=1 Tax=Paenibacillus sp. FSL R7-0128 TaxID=2954529 RepID=UPI0030F69A98
MKRYKHGVAGLLMFLALVLPVTPVFADITWNPVMEGYDMTEDEYFAEAAEGESGTFSFTGGKFVNPQNAYFYVAGIYTTSLPFASTFSVDVTFSDGFTRNIIFNSSKYAQITVADFKDHPSKAITLKLNSDGKKAHKVYMNGYGLKDYDGPGPTAAPTTKPTSAPTPAPTVKPTVKPTSTTTPKPSSGTSTPGPSASPSDPGGGDPGGGDPGGGDDGGNCLCEDLCEIMPGILAGFGDQLDGIAGSLAPLHHDLAIVQDQLFGVRDDLNGINGQLQQINSNTAPLHDDLNDIKALTGELIRQVTPIQNYYPPSPVVVPNYYKPPDVAASPYVDNGQYFSDNGDAAAPDAMPAAPEPKNWQVNGQVINQDAEMVPAPKQSQAPLQSQAPAQTQSPLQTQAPVQSQAPVQTQSPIQNQAPVQSQSPVQSQAPLQSQAPVQSQTPHLIKDKELEVDRTEYPLRWESGEFP